MSWTRSESGLHEEEQGGDKKITQGRETFLHAPLGEKKRKRKDGKANNTVTPP